MKLVVFAHTPPPHHGQSYMVQLMLEGFGGDRRKRNAAASEGARFGLDCFHVNARLSTSVNDIGKFQLRKLVLLCGYCLQAIWCRFRYGATSFYYIPAPGQRTALYRDWLVMILCRPFFKRVILHWHAAGLTEWLETVPWWMRWVTMCLLGRPHQSIVLSRYNTADGVRMRSKYIEVVHNGIADSCPEFEEHVVETREARCLARKQLLAGGVPTAADMARTGADAHLFKVLYIAHCSREKGLFDAVEAVAMANEWLRKRGVVIRIQLTVAGEFVSHIEREEFELRLNQPDLHGLSEMESQSSPAATVSYLGFIGGDQKKHALIHSDCFCLPTYYSNENQPVSLLEAMAFGLPIVTTRWRSLPEMFPDDYVGLVDIRSPEQIARAFINVISGQSGEPLRQEFLRKFTLEQHLRAMAAALQRHE
jgi:glycosyltransferase involved in cell wall biosynthesis